MGGVYGWHRRLVHFVREPPPRRRRRESHPALRASDGSRNRSPSRSEASTPVRSRRRPEVRRGASPTCPTRPTLSDSNVRRERRTASAAGRPREARRRRVSEPASAQRAMRCPSDPSGPSDSARFARSPRSWPTGPVVRHGDVVMPRFPETSSALVRGVPRPRPLQWGNDGRRASRSRHHAARPYAR